ncbi:MAG: HU family DNA-binding protein [Phycisphaeraceae bacterium]|nr:HU family DNA-binding protein [Phycisphaeraceae bacterium]
MAKKKKKTKKKAAAKKPPTKTEIYRTIAEDTELSRKEVAAVFDSLSGLIKKNIGRNGPGVFTVPGLMKIKRREIPRKPARKNVWVPLLNEYRDIPAKPARRAVKALPLKGLKDMV